MNRRDRTVPGAFTLLETLLASAIAVMLFVAAVRVATVFRDGGSEAVTGSDSAILHDLIARDLEQATTHEWRGTELHILTVAKAAHDDHAGPARVVYYEVEDHGRHWLLRSVRGLADINSRWSTELLAVCDGGGFGDEPALSRSVTDAYAPASTPGPGQDR